MRLRVFGILVLVLVLVGLCSVLAQAQKPAVEPDLLCGVKCLYTGLLALGVEPGSYAEFINKCGKSDARGYSLGQLEEVAKTFGVETLPVNTSFENLRRRSGPFVCIAHVDGNHFVNIGDADQTQVWIVDPPRDGPVTKEVFAQRWDGTALLLSRTRLVPEEELGGSRAWIWGVAGLLLLGGVWIWRRREKAA